MPRTYRFLLNRDHVLWKDQLDYDAVLTLKRDTPTDVWQAGYQGDPVAPDGTIFQRTWWEHGKARYAYDQPQYEVYARYLSFDTAFKDTDASDYTGYTVLELTTDFRILIREVRQAKVESADLPSYVKMIALTWNTDGLLREIVLEDKGSGITTVQAIKNSIDIAWIPPMIRTYKPNTSKTQRARWITPFCKAGLILFPQPHAYADWLGDFFDELFQFPASPHDDRTDSFVQGCLWLEWYLSDALNGITAFDDATGEWQ